MARMEDGHIVETAMEAREMELRYAGLSFLRWLGNKGDQHQSFGSLQTTSGFKLTLVALINLAPQMCILRSFA